MTTSSRLFPFMFLLLFLSLGPATLRAEQDLNSIPAAIVDIRLFDSWEADGKAGVYRGIITVPRPGKATFTLQWLAFDENGALASVEHSLAIPEIAELDGIVTDYRSEVDGQGLALYLDVQASADAAAETFVIYVDGPDAYTFEGASN